MRKMDEARKMVAKITNPLQVYTLDVKKFRRKYDARTKDCCATLVVCGAGTKDEQIVGIGIKHFYDLDPLYFGLDPLYFGIEIYLVEFPKMKQPIDLNSLPDYYDIEVDTFVNNLDKINGGVW